MGRDGARTEGMVKVHKKVSYLCLMDVGEGYPPLTWEGRMSVCEILGDERWSDGGEW